MTDAIENLASILCSFHFIYTPYYYYGTMYRVEKEVLKILAPSILLFASTYSNDLYYLTTTPFDNLCCADER
jgi:hypothetical protein